jgi:hypothetical protein
LSRKRRFGPGLSAKVRKNSPSISSLGVIDRDGRPWHFSLSFDGKGSDEMPRKKAHPENSGKAPDPEYGFELPLRMTVEGKTGSGEDFQEETVLDYMSYKTALFELKNEVVPGTPLKLIISLPPKLSEKKRLCLAVRGHVDLVRASNNRMAPSVTLKLGSRYIIKPDES